MGSKGPIIVPDSQRGVAPETGRKDLDLFLDLLLRRLTQYEGALLAAKAHSDARDVLNLKVALRTILRDLVDEAEGQGHQDLLVEFLEFLGGMGAINPEAWDRNYLPIEIASDFLRRRKES